jgi:hypothetical protein
VYATNLDMTNQIGSKDSTAEVTNKGNHSKKKKGRYKAGDHVTAYATDVIEDVNL